MLHRCDITLCVRPDCLFLGTQHDNMHDMGNKGRKRGGGWTKETAPRGEKCSWSKYSDADVAEIRRLYSETDLTAREIGEKYGSTKEYIFQLVHGYSRSETKIAVRHKGRPERCAGKRPTALPSLRKLTMTQVREIRASNLMGKELAKLYGVSEATISVVRNNRSKAYRNGT